jgi:hypothetical protein
MFGLFGRAEEQPKLTPAEMVRPLYPDFSCGKSAFLADLGTGGGGCLNVTWGGLLEVGETRKTYWVQRVVGGSHRAQIDRLSDRIANASLPEDRRSAVRSLLGMTQDHRVGAQGVRVCVPVCLQVAKLRMGPCHSPVHAVASVFSDACVPILALASALDSGGRMSQIRCSFFLSAASGSR